MAILIEIARKSMGNVNDCKLVMAKSNEYREGQDYLAEFYKNQQNLRKSGNFARFCKFEKQSQVIFGNSWDKILSDFWH